MKECTTCGTQYEDNADNCLNCSSSLNTTFESAEQPPQVSPQPYQYKPHIYQPHIYQQHSFPHPLQKYNTMGGWLLFFVICNIIGLIGNLIAIIIRTNRYIGTISGTIRITSPSTTYSEILLLGVILGVCSTVFTILFLIRIFQRKSSFLCFYQLNVLAILVYAFFPDGSGSFIGLIAGFFLLTLYYCKSIRVRTYMGSDEYMKKAIFAFKNQPPLNRPPMQEEH